jgi:hypothetical protein
MIATPRHPIIVGPPPEGDERQVGNRFAGSYATRGIQPELPSITAPIVARPEYVPANLAEQG